MVHIQFDTAFARGSVNCHANFALMQKARYLNHHRFGICPLSPNHQAVGASSNLVLVVSLPIQ